MEKALNAEVARYRQMALASDFVSYTIFVWIISDLLGLFMESSFFAFLSNISLFYNAYNNHFIKLDQVVVNYAG